MQANVEDQPFVKLDYLGVPWKSVRLETRPEMYVNVITHNRI
jgi:hypothetical protein